MAISIICPQCAKVLRSSVRPPEGKKVKCPNCSTVFLPVINEAEDNAAQIQAAPRLKASPSTKRRAPLEDEEEDAAPAKKKKSKNKAGSKVMLYAILGIAGGGGALLCCVGLGVGAFFYFRSSEPDLIAYVPPDANLLAGGNPRLLFQKSPEFEKFIRQKMDETAKMKGEAIHAASTNLIFNSERMLSYGFSKSLEAKTPFFFVASNDDFEKLKRDPLLGQAQVIGGHANVHKISAENQKKGLPAFIAFPGGRLVIVSEQTEKEFIDVLDRGKKPRQSNATVDLSRSVDAMPFWIAWTPDAENRRQLKQQFEAGAKASNAMRNAIPALENVKGVTAKCDITTGKDVQITANLLCKDAKDAANIKGGVEEVWGGFKGLLMMGLMMAPQGPADGPKAFARDLSGMKFEVNDDAATASLLITSDAIKELADQAAKKPGGLKRR